MHTSSLHALGITLYVVWNRKMDTYKEHGIASYYYLSWNHTIVFQYKHSEVERKLCQQTHWVVGFHGDK